MSTSEKWTNDYSPCPCGKGKILEHVDAPDNPWSRPSYEYSLECEDCSSEYILIGMELRRKQAYEDARNSWSNRYRVEKELTKFCKVAIDEIVKDMCIGDLRDEYRVLVSVGICSEGPIRYPRLRRGGAKSSDLCQPLANIGWIINKLSDKAKVDKISEMKDEMDRYETKWRAAGKEENPVSITSLKAKWSIKRFQ